MEPDWKQIAAEKLLWGCERRGQRWSKVLAREEDAEDAKCCPRVNEGSNSCACEISTCLILKVMPLTSTRMTSDNLFEFEMLFTAFASQKSRTRCPCFPKDGNPSSCLGPLHLLQSLEMTI